MNHTYIKLDKTNIKKEHLCCAISDKKHAIGVENKKTWLKSQLDQGLTFRKLDARGKIFIEYSPVETCFKPVTGSGYLFINCLWVSGRFKGQGHAKDLLSLCKKDAQNTNGIAVISGKKPFLTDSKFYAAHGFKKIDTAPPYFDLMVYQKNTKAELPQFSVNAKEQIPPSDKDLVFFYTDQCPMILYYFDEMKTAAKNRGLSIDIIHLTKREEVLKSPSPFGTFGVFYKGHFLTHEILTEKRLSKFLKD